MFKDHFSGHAEQYKNSRPSYPDSLFAYLASLADEHELVWDCATGNGQAAISLASYFKKVIATDASEQQIKNAKQHKNVEYRIALADSSGLAKQSVDLITVAQALHWFNFDKFYAEVTRVLKPKGVLAVWCYDLFTTENQQLNKLITEFYQQVIRPYWPVERRYIEQGYQTIPFPFTEINTPHFEIKPDWNIEQLLGYLNSWSAVKRYEQEKKKNPIESWVIPHLKKLGIKETVFLQVKIPIVLRAGRLVR